ncbi:MAG TPA: UpxY family transcription antiterminator [Puia sp.]|nr:UpxY family transcription antiterminator [Puia sp.]
MDKNWYAVYTKPRLEKKIAETLSKMNFENYCPLNTAFRQPKERKKNIQEPLFSSYVFVKANENELFQIRSIDGIINFVYWLHKPVVISNEEISAIKNFLNEHNYARLEKSLITGNDKTKTTNGALMHIENDMSDTSKKVVKVLLPSLGYTMTAQVEKQNVKIIVNKPSVDHAAI